jgi:predicted ATPase
MTDSAVDDGTARAAVPFITRVRLRNYKSIASCDVRLGPLTILVGPNGSGKSNFLDALAFVARALETTPGEAISEHGGFAEIARRVPTATDSFSIGLDLAIPREPGSRLRALGSYEIEVVRGRDGREFQIENERLRLSGAEAEGFHALRGVDSFRVFRGVVEDHGDGLVGRLQPPDEIGRDRLYLPIAGARGGYARALFSSLQRITRYNFDLEVLRQPQRSLLDPVLGAAGQHLGDVLGTLARESRGYKDRLDTYVQAIVSGALGVDSWPVGSRVAVRLRTKTGQDGREVEFGPDSMSDGTLRAAAVLAALFQRAARQGIVPLVAIEEPEIALHPAAAGVLFDALTEASEHVQVVATSQSADLLDREDLDVSVIRPVTMQSGLTIIGEVDDASREITKEKLYTLGELMRGNQLSPALPGSGDQEE